MTKRKLLDSLDKFTRSYIETALWATTDNADGPGGEPLDKNYDSEDISLPTLRAMVADCKAFQEDNRADLADEGDGRAGHNFWLTRERHGAGFWDGDYEAEKGRRLTEAAHAYGSFNLMAYRGLVRN